MCSSSLDLVEACCAQFDLLASAMLSSHAALLLLSNRILFRFVSKTSLLAAIQVLVLVFVVWSLVLHIGSLQLNHVSKFC